MAQKDLKGQRTDVETASFKRALDQMGNLYVRCVPSSPADTSLISRDSRRVQASMAATAVLQLQNIAPMPSEFKGVR